MYWFFSIPMNVSFLKRHQYSILLCVIFVAAASFDGDILEDLPAAVTDTLELDLSSSYQEYNYEPDAYKSDETKIDFSYSVGEEDPRGVGVGIQSMLWSEAENEIKTLIADSEFPSPNLDFTLDDSSSQADNEAPISHVNDKFNGFVALNANGSGNNERRRNKATPSLVATFKSTSSIDDWSTDKIYANENSIQQPFPINHDDILNILGLSSYPESSVCTSTMGVIIESSFRDILPTSFQRYSCSRVLDELKYHRSTSMWTENAVLEDFFFSILGIDEQDMLNDSGEWKHHPLVKYYYWLNDSIHHCSWGGVTCGYTTVGVGIGNHANKVDAAVEHDGYECSRSRLKDRAANRCDGTRLLDGWTCKPCPSLKSITKLDLTSLQLTGMLTDNLFMLTHLHRLNIRENRIRGTIPITIGRFQELEFLDVGGNFMSGQLPALMPISLTEVWLENNRFSGTIPKSLRALAFLSHFDVSDNFLEGSIPNIIGNMTWINRLYLRGNKFTGRIPEFLPTMHLQTLDLSRNFLEGPVPPSLSRSLFGLEELDLSSNQLTGLLPDFSYLNDAIVNLTGNKFEGTISSSMCTGPFSSMFGCNSFMCEHGYFSPAGSASHFGPCVRCADTVDSLLGQQTCASRNYIVGDLNEDGILSEREVLHLLFVFTQGFGWGPTYLQKWGDLKTSACDLPGIWCDENKVTQINLTDARICSGYRKYPPCIGLPSEIGLLPNLKSLDLGGPTAILKGSIPTEISTLTSLEYVNLEESSLTGSIPSDILGLQSLRFLNLQSSGLSGQLPSFVSSETRLKVLNLALNNIDGSIPSSYGNLTHLNELIMSRNKLTGTIIDFSNLKELDNLELYGNSLRGIIPKTLGGCSSLKRIDLYSNKLTGTIPSELGDIPALQIIHLKTNQIEGSLPQTLLSALPNFLWLDVSGNRITGTIPSAYGQSSSLKDLRLGGNKIHGPIAGELCHNKGLNNAPVGENDACDHILCPLGTFSQTGFASTSSSCQPCPAGKSTIHLGSYSCLPVTQRDVLRMFYNYLMKGDLIWDEKSRRGWKSEESLCGWSGVTCENDVVTGLSFPVSGLK